MCSIPPFLYPSKQPKTLNKQKGKQSRMNVDCAPDFLDNPASIDVRNS